MRYIKLFEELNYYQYMDAEEAIANATRDYSLAMKTDNIGKADKILGNLKSRLDQLRYNWKQDPRALELLSDFISDPV